MTHEERLRAINTLNDWRRDEPEIVGVMVAAVLRHHDMPHVGHLAHHHPDAFDLLYEEVEAMMTED